MDVRVDALDDEVGLQPNARLIKLEVVEPPIACPMRTLSSLIELTESTSRFLHAMAPPLRVSNQWKVVLDSLWVMVTSQDD